MTTTAAHPNLSNKTGSISYALMSVNDEVNQMINDNTSPCQMKLFLRDTVMNITDKDYVHKSPATKRFLMALEKQNTKQGIGLLVYNTILSGDNLRAV